MPLKSVLEALGIDPSATDDDIATHVRELAGLSGPSANPALWVRVLDAFTHQVLSPRSLQISDLGDLAYRLTTTYICPDDDDVRWNSKAWRNEVGISDPQELDEWLHALVSRIIGPILFRAGLSRAQ